MSADIVTSPEAATTPSVEALGSNTFHEFIRYFVASGAALILDTGLLWLLTSVFNVPYLISGAISFLVGLTSVYVLSIIWVFEHRAVRSPSAEFLIFCLIGAIGLGINEIMLWLFTSLFGFYYLVSKLASVVVVFSWNFFARKFLLFA
ncbi:GtrA family protein [Candidatus Kaiserbacteria bacterium]|nr:GtrA family protein [Candidatus Kaiserbacteria bacterium]